MAADCVAGMAVAARVMTATRHHVVAAPCAPRAQARPRALSSVLRPRSYQGLRSSPRARVPCAIPTAVFSGDSVNAAVATNQRAEYLRHALVDLRAHRTDVMTLLDSTARRQLGEAKPASRM